ncbi:MAG: hypothetical protein DRH08_00160 [Deltaproteobacteria bacterium]|nr:MAG: hypothetical protein DRH08_00160 [Deltaproteobacteria bacterium]
MNTAWLIENVAGTLWLGVDGDRLRLGSPELAVRFVRESDAQGVAAWIARREGIALRVTEHEWHD